ncbi:MAG: tRNA pseudouridine(38-40) synthase TruA, partial [Candidatus Diapherotrites archaeon]|nr:tRNA pseudouridine(38-40) synthase TruA [Candidatus Diapherotrites archaeon]
MRFAVKVMYIGESFSGVARQPKKRTVEEEFLKAIKSLESQKINVSSVRFASRTDAGVSAACNVFSFDCEKKPNLLAIHHALPKDIACYAIAEVSDDFNPRFTHSKTYRYVLPDFNSRLDLKKMQSCASVLVGVHSFHNFCRRDKRDFEREIFSIEIKKQKSSDKFVSIEICGASFLWEMVRR